MPYAIALRIASTCSSCACGDRLELLVHAQPARARARSISPVVDLDAWRARSATSRGSAAKAAQTARAAPAATRAGACPACASRPRSRPPTYETSCLIASSDAVDALGLRASRRGARAARCSARIRRCVRVGDRRSSCAGSAQSPSRARAARAAPAATRRAGDLRTTTDSRSSQRRSSYSSRALRAELLGSVERALEQRADLGVAACARAARRARSRSERRRARSSRRSSARSGTPAVEQMRTRPRSPDARCARTARASARCSAVALAASSSARRARRAPHAWRERVRDAVAAQHLAARAARASAASTLRGRAAGSSSA